MLLGFNDIVKVDINYLYTMCLFITRMLTV